MGEITVSGGKNTAVAVIPATLLCDEPCTIENLPDIEDVHVLIQILRSLGAEVEYVPGHHLTVDPRPATGYHVPYSMSSINGAGMWKTSSSDSRSVKAIRFCPASRTAFTFSHLRIKGYL